MCRAECRVQYLAEGSGSAEVDGETAALVIFQAVAVIVMALCLPEFARAETWTKKLAALGVAVVLGVVHYLNTIEVGSHSRDTKTATLASIFENLSKIERIRINFEWYLNLRCRRSAGLFS